MNRAIEFDRVDYSHTGNRVISDLSFSMVSGEFLVLLGRSGSGKTTTLKLVNALLTPTAGKVFVAGKATSDWDPIRLRRQIGYVIQEAGLFPHFTVEQNVALVPHLEEWPADKIRSQVYQMLELVGLEPKVFRSRYPRQLSGGQRQRVGIARALAADPPMMLLDEPFGALDPITRAEVRQEFRDLHRRLHKTVIFVTHDLREAFFLGTRIGLIHEGHLIAIVAPDEFLKLDHPEVQAFARCLE